MAESQTLPGPKLVIEGPLPLTQAGASTEIKTLTIAFDSPGRLLFWLWDRPETEGTALPASPETASFSGGSRIICTSDDGTTVFDDPPSRARTCRSFDFCSFLRACFQAETTV